MAPDEHCRHLLGSLSDYVDAAASEEICAEIERHLAECEDCRVVVDTLRKTVSLYHASRTSPEIPADVRQRLYKCLDLTEFLPDEKSADPH
jgi:predicted anti-sigma-YlaC factor YlaD